MAAPGREFIKKRASTRLLLYFVCIDTTDFSMFSSSLARIVLIAALVFSQTLYAGHTMLHNDSSQMDCQVCLHASPVGAALPCDELDSVVAPPSLLPDCGYIAPVISSTFQNSHPTRAPPFSCL